jgi:Stress responsive A/B Barrel Domain
MIDHLVLFTLEEGTSRVDEEDVLSTFRELRDKIPNFIDFSIGKNFSERSQGYTHGLFARSQTRDDLQAYLKHPEHLSAVEKLDALQEGERVVVDYEF